MFIKIIIRVELNRDRDGNVYIKRIEGIFFNKKIYYVDKKKKIYGLCSGPLFAYDSKPLG